MDLPSISDCKYLEEEDCGFLIFPSDLGKSAFRAWGCDDISVNHTWWDVRSRTHGWHQGWGVFSSQQELAWHPQLLSELTPIVLCAPPPQIQASGEAEGELWHSWVPGPRSRQLWVCLVPDGHVECGSHHLHAVSAQGPGFPLGMEVICLSLGILRSSKNLSARSLLGSCPQEKHRGVGKWNGEGRQLANCVVEPVTTVSNWSLSCGEHGTHSGSRWELVQLRGGSRSIYTLALISCC